jgi:hypothetical protein
LVSGLSGAALLAASVATRFGIFDGGVASARDPKYTVVPQRERLAARAAAERSGQDRADIQERDVTDGGAVGPEQPEGPAIGI